MILSDGRDAEYDYLLMATGTSPRPDQTPGMTTDEWRKSIFDFYTLDGAIALREKLANWPGGRLVVHIVEMPIKCPVAPLEFAFLADAYFAQRHARQGGHHLRDAAGRRVHQTDRVPKHLGGMLRGPAHRDRGRFRHRPSRPGEQVAGLDGRARGAVRLAGHHPAEHGRGVHRPVRPRRRAQLRAGGQAHDAVKAVRQHLRLGDASNIPTSKAGSVAHFSVDVFAENFVEHVAGCR